MRITPMDIRQQQFTVKMFRGFDVQEVDTFLEDVAQDYEALMRENTLLKEQLQALEERTRGLEERERVLQQTLVTTQRLTEEMKEGARREAALAVREAEVAGEKLLEAARTEEAVIRSEIMLLKRNRRQLAEGIRSTIEMYQRMVEPDLRSSPREGAAPGAEPPASAEEE
ncbi:MAG: DivIVA domain-containing protein [Candidatus Rokubacteria bacterium]|nr:DivIVA domain-containing protein [Candidatus Rokubacteria bacterium]MBI3106409.1 DivIVA domain-containing protein [Candidatus Rokubacteria bacterium]